jgi:GNAT superfamily N-acetyltransferase
MRLQPTPARSFEVEDGAPLAYCYELQLEAAAQRKGLGKHLMQLLELIVSEGWAGRGFGGVGAASQSHGPGRA